MAQCLTTRVSYTVVGLMQGSTGAGTSQCPGSEAAPGPLSPFEDPMSAPSSHGVDIHPSHGGYEEGLLHMPHMPPSPFVGCFSIAEGAAPLLLGDGLGWCSLDEQSEASAASASLYQSAGSTMSSWAASAGEPSQAGLPDWLGRHKPLWEADEGGLSAAGPDAAGGLERVPAGSSGSAGPPTPPQEAGERVRWAPLRPEDVVYQRDERGLPIMLGWGAFGAVRPLLNILCYCHHPNVLPLCVIPLPKVEGLTGLLLITFRL